MLFLKVASLVQVTPLSIEYSYFNPCLSGLNVIVGVSVLPVIVLVVIAPGVAPAVSLVLSIQPISDLIFGISDPAISHLAVPSSLNPVAGVTLMNK